MSDNMYDELEGTEHPPISDAELEEHLSNVDDETLFSYYENRSEWGENAYQMVVKEVENRIVV